MADIEFLNPAAQAPEPVPPRPAASAPVPAAPRVPEHRLRELAVRTVFCALLLLAAGLCVLAAFRSVYIVELGGEQFNYRASVDGWGRVGVTVRGEGSTSSGVRFGIGLAVAAGLLVLAAALRWLPVRRAATAALATATGGIGVLLGVLGSTLLDVQSEYDNLHAQLTGTQGQTSRPSFDFTVGWFTWLGLIALGCALFALVAPPVVRRLWREAPAEPDAPYEPADGHPLDERLSDGRAPLA